MKVPLDTFGLAIYGSALNGFGLKKSDIDLTILTNCYLGNECDFLYLIKTQLESMTQ